MNTLRWILLVIGIFVIILIYLWGRRQSLQEMRRMRIEAQAGGPNEIRGHHEEGFDEPAPGLVERELSRLGRLIAETTLRSRKEDDLPEAEPEPAAIDPHDLIVLYVRAPAGVPFRGENVFRALEASGLRYGPMQIYHRVMEAGGREKSVFSVANLVEPGIFDHDDPESFTTPGLTLFMQLPGPLDGVKAYDDMVETARGLARELDGEVCDQSRSVLTRQSIGHQREEILDKQRRMRIAQNRQ
jgi:cell division protein ZipA